jgi:hypothetical protein
VSESARSYRTYRINISRAAIGIVLFINIQCAVQFLGSPSVYMPGFGLTGIPGEIALRGTAILFLMWNVPYVFALVHPEKFRVSYLQTVIMQFIGLIGETLLWLTLSSGNNVISSSLVRFILFDGAGLGLLVLGFLIIPQTQRVK